MVTTRDAVGALGFGSLGLLGAALAVVGLTVACAGRSERQGAGGAAGDKDASGGSGGGGRAGAGEAGGEAGGPGSGDAGAEAGDAGRGAQAGSGAGTSSGGTAGAGAGTGGVGGLGAGAGVGGGSAGDDGCLRLGPESCFNGNDDDCDGNTDCADEECTRLGECVPDAPGFAVGAGVDEGSPCPNYFAAGSKLFGQGLSAPLLCTGGTGVSYGCYSVAEELPADMCPSSDPQGQSLSTAVVTTGAPCVTGGTGLNMTSGAVYLHPVQVAASCVSTGAQSLETISWEQQTNFCATTELGGGCMPGSHCVAKVEAGKHCVAKSGVAACPSGYTAEGSEPWYLGVDDQRECNQFDLGPASGGSCTGGRLHLYASNDCTGDSEVVSGDANACFVNSPINSISIEVDEVIAPTCRDQHAASGTAYPTDLHTLCCL